MNILETNGLYHDFGGLEVLFNVNLEVKEGERHAQYVLFGQLPG